KTQDDLYLRMVELMEKNQFMRLKRNVMQVEGITNKDKKTLQKQMEEMDQWSFLHLLSYLVYRPKIETLHLKLIEDRKSTRLNSSHVSISYDVFCLKSNN